MLNRRLLIIFNSYAGNGKPLSHKATIERTLQDAGLPFDAYISDSADHFDALIRQSLHHSYTDLVLVGGDGTLHRAVNLIMKQPESVREKLSLGLIALGTGNDWIRTYHPSLSIEENIFLIIRGKTVLQDIGKMETNHEVSYFNNMAGFGLSGMVVQHSIALKKWGRLSYILGAIRAIIGYHSVPVKISSPTFSHTINLFALFAGVGQYAGGNMKLCPTAIPHDGHFHLTLIRKQSYFKLIQLIPKLFNGRLSDSPFIQVIQTPSFSIETLDSNHLPGESDGEAKHANHYHIQILPKALRFIV